MNADPRPRARHRRLIQVARSHVPSRWANSIQVVHMACALAPHFERAELLVPFHPKRYLLSRVRDPFASYGRRRPGNLRVRYVRRGGAGSFEAAAVKRLERAEDALVYTRSLAVAAWLASTSRPVIFESHDSLRDEAHPSFDGFIGQLAGGGRGGVACISTALRDFYLARGVPETRLGVFPDGVDEAFFEATPRGVLGRWFGPAVDRARMVLYVGSLQPEKGAQVLREAARLEPGYSFVVIGGRPEEARELAAGAPENLYVRPHVPHGEVPAALAEADYLAMPYLDAGKWVHCMSPLKMLEYLATGKPVLSSRLPVLTDVLEEGVNCLMFDPGSPQGLIDTLRRAEALGPEGRATLGRRGRETATRLSWSGRASRLVAWYEGLEVSGDEVVR